MEPIKTFFIPLSTWLKPHLPFIATAFTTALLVIYGDYINRAVKGHFRQNHFIIRTTVFILLCSIGYGLLTAWLTPAVNFVLLYFGDAYFAPTVILAFVALGILAERKRYM
jgi:hypothetical protein